MMMMSSNVVDGCVSSISPSYAVIPYNPVGVLAQFHEDEKVFILPGNGRKIRIKQDWANNGVAGVVWEAVSDWLVLLTAVE